LLEAGRAVAHDLRFAGADAARRHRLPQRELRPAVETSPDVRGGRRLLLDPERAVRVTGELFGRQAPCARDERRPQDFAFHRFIAAFNLRLALTMYALAPLVLVSPSA